MDERMKDLLKDLEQYIQENWIAPDEDKVDGEKICEKMQSHFPADDTCSLVFDD